MREVLEDATEVYKFVKTDRIDSMKIEAVEEGDLEESFATQSICDTRMNTAHLCLTAIMKQYPFVSSLAFNPKWRDFLDERKPADKTQWEATLMECSENRR